MIDKSKIDKWLNAGVSQGRQDYEQMQKALSAWKRQAEEQLEQQAQQVGREVFTGIGRVLGQVTSLVMGSTQATNTQDPAESTPSAEPDQVSDDSQAG